MSDLALVNGRLIDGTGAAQRDGWGVVVRDGKIHSLGPVGSLSLPADAEVLDVEGRTIMPGLIDPHTHLTYHAGEYGLVLQQLNESLELNTIRAVETAKLLLETGCTAIGDGGTRGNISVAIRDAVAEGIIPGPKVVASGQIISGSGGLQDHTFVPGYTEDAAFLGTVVNGPLEVRTVVRKQVRAGVDWVKISVSGVPGSRHIDGHTQDLEYDEIQAAVQEAAKFGKTVHAHAHDSNGLKDAVRAGVISLHSGEFVDDEGLELMKEHNSVFVPTIAWLHFRGHTDYAREYSRAFKLNDAQLQQFVDECLEAYEACRDAIVKAHRIGTPTAVGSDGAHTFPPYDIALEMEYFQELGIPPLQVITDATKVAAQAVNRSDDWGTLEPGKAADVLIVDGDPSADVKILKDKSRIVMILQDGRKVKNTLLPQLAEAHAS